MAKNPKEVDKKQKELMKKISNVVDNFLTPPPVVAEDGTLSSPRYKTNILKLDLLLNGGLPKAKIVALGTEEGIGKTTMMLQACGEVVESSEDLKCYYIDVEGGATFELINAIGISHLVYHPTNNPEGRFFVLGVTTIQEIAVLLSNIAKDPTTALVVIDSDTAVVDGRDLEDEKLGTENKAAALNARMWSSVAPQISAIVKKSSIAMIILHQARTNLQGFRPKVESTGCRAIRHIVSAEIWGRRLKYIDEEGNEVSSKRDSAGVFIELSTNKNRLTMPFVGVTMPLFFGKGVSNRWAYKEWLEENTFTDKATGEQKNYIDKGGAGYYTINKPDGTSDRVRGASEVMRYITDNYDEIVNIVEQGGGFSTHSSDTFDDVED